MPRDYDRYLYKLRRFVENAFPKLKQRQGIATRYAKRTDSFLAPRSFDVLLSGLKSIDDNL